jgi:hypothetical protein
VSPSEKTLMRDALEVIETQKARIQHLEGCIREAAGTINEYEQLAKARGEHPASAANTITKAINAPQRGAQSAWYLLPGLVAAQKARFEHESLSQEGRIAKAQDLLRKARQR